MAEEGGNDTGLSFLLFFFGGIFAIWLLSSGGQYSIFGNASSTSIFPSASSSSLSTYNSPISDEQATLDSAQSRDSIEAELHDASRELDQLRADLRTAQVWGVASPFQGKVRLTTGNVWSTDAQTEYLILTHAGSDETIPITGWTVESFVTGERASIPEGTRLVRTNALNTPSTLLLDARETAYLVTGESPLGISFHENACTGYLAEFQSFSPPLATRCPFPREEMETLGTIALDDDSCYEAVAQVGSCSIPSINTFSRRLSPACRTFLEHDLSYAGCVRNHQSDPYFYDGSWRIYLSERYDLWRNEREIIRLLDSEGRVIDVIEY